MGTSGNHWVCSGDCEDNSSKHCDDAATTCNYCNIEYCDECVECQDNLCLKCKCTIKTIKSPYINDIIKKFDLSKRLFNSHMITKDTDSNDKKKLELLEGILTQVYKDIDIILYLT
jgi:hypothetical protein